MLRLILGKAGAGKTSAIMGEISRAVDKKESKYMLIVPEQYSHEAERELCRVCGDSLSLYAEVFSFTGLARRIMALQGGGAEKYLDKGGRLLCMSLALNSAGSKLKVYTGLKGRAELQAGLLSAIDEFKSAGISTEQLEQASADCGGALGDKLMDLALISEAYSAAVGSGRADPSDRLTVLARQTEESSFGEGCHIYVDGFIDFTNQELEVLYGLLKNGAELCVCMTVDSMDSDNEIFELSRISCRRLIEKAEALGIEVRTEFKERAEEKNGALSYFADNMFSYGEGQYEGDSSAIKLSFCGSIAEECELAAAKALELVRDRGLHWRDIAIAVRGFDEYSAVLENTFSLYGVPLFTARRSSLLQKPLPSLISLAYEIVLGGWETEDLISYMRTGLTDLNESEADMLADYIFTWQLKGSAWQRKADWKQHPEGYGAEDTEESGEKLRKINELRRIIAQPLLKLQRRCGESRSAVEQASALAEFMAELKLPEKMEQRAAMLDEEGKKELSQEYRQLWDIIINAIEQSAAILGDTAMEAEEFSRLFSLMLSKYDVGSIPVSLDRVSAGDFDRMRRRSIKELIVLGCSDNRLPKAEEDGGIFSQEERRRLMELDIDIGGGGSELWREFSLIYNCLSLPSQGLTMSYAMSGSEGDAQRACFVYSRAARIFGTEPVRADMNRVRTASRASALGLAANSFRSPGPAAAAAAAYFEELEPESFGRLKSAADLSRKKLSQKSVELLYGSRIRLSASRIDKFASCKYAYFCQYGLKAKPYEPAGFKPPEVGSFMHYILENTARDVQNSGGFKAVSDEQLHELTDKYVAEYVKTELNNFREKSKRFIYLFRRLTKDVHSIVADMAEELRRSDFEPVDFELNFARATDIKPFDTGDGSGLSLTGIADRVDGWLHEGKLYLRVVDYKTGRKKFSLSDVCYGMGLQMLLYLFTLQEGGEERYGGRIIPAGVIYVPARNSLLSLDKDMEDEKCDSKRRDELRRSGLVLDNEEMLSAWEKGEDKRYIPVKFKAGRGSGDNIASLQRMGALSRHIKKTLSDMARELRGGSIAADPVYRSQQENACMNCDYFEACHFAQGENGEVCRYIPRLKDKEAWSLIEGGGENG